MKNKFNLSVAAIFGLLPKTTFLKFLGVVSFVITWLAPIHLAIATVLLAILLDTCVGIWAARVVAAREGLVVREVVTSKKARIGFISKSLTYLGLLLMAFFIDKMLLHDLAQYFFSGLNVSFFATKFLAFLFVVFEFDSFDEKYYRVKGVSIKTLLTNRIRGIKRGVMSVKETMKPK